MIDWRHVADLYEDFGEEGFAEVVQVFVEESLEGLQNLAQSQSAEDDRAAFHFLKGAALNIGFKDMAALCAEGEAAAAAGQDTSVQKEKVGVQFPLTCQKFQQQWRAKLGAGS